MIKYPSISICIPAYNRPRELLELLESIEQQKYLPLEVIVCEDKSPERDAIRSSIEEYKIRSRLVIRYIENEINLGYDANLRKSISLASGDYVFLSGNDDILDGSALQIVCEKILKHSPHIIIRSYASFYKNSTFARTFHRYVKDDLIVNFSEEEAAWLFYRSVLVSGLVFKSQLAKDLQSNLVDGTLYYQNYLLTKMFMQGPALYVPDILIHNRILDAGDFGSSEIEAKGEWVPGERSIRSSLYQMQKFFDCAMQVEAECGIRFTTRLRVIASAYSFPLLAYHADKPLSDYIYYIRSLQKLGYRGYLFYIYAILLKLIGLNLAKKILNITRKVVGHTKRIV